MSEPKLPPRIACNAGCGVTVADEPEAQIYGWTWLMVARGWRCPACVRSLTAASTLPGTAPAPFVDALAPDSRGALRKETATTITPPTVKV